MPRKPVLYAVLAALVAAVTFTVARPATVSAAAPIKIMPLGDSITGGPGCWRAYLWNHLQTTGFTNIDFVGSQPGGGCPGGFAYDGDNEGHGGFAATGIADQNQLPPWLDAARPDIVLMHLGTNDTWGGFIPTATKLAAYTKLVGQMRASNPNMKIVVAKIIPMNPPGCATCAPDVVALNNAIPGWAAGLTTAQSPIVVADLWTGFDTVADTNGDGVHPNDAGFRKMADRWYPALTPLLGGAVVTPTSTSPSSPSGGSSTPPAGGACTAGYRVVSQWSDGFQGEVSVRNSTTAARSAWTATVTFGNGQRITQSWSATVTQTGAAATAENLSWNGSLAAGASTTFGFLASWTGSNAAPAVSCTVR
ncbi:MAG TPA: cellulose binding domain-containing protein [Mycobacteriales bacterium]|nr:cellulose binding domain-containing protein [Mycobacteriales bacterium]